MCSLLEALVKDGQKNAQKYTSPRAPFHFYELVQRSHKSIFNIYDKKRKNGMSNTPNAF